MLVWSRPILLCTVQCACLGEEHALDTTACVKSMGGEVGSFNDLDLNPSGRAHNMPGTYFECLPCQRIVLELVLPNSLSSYWPCWTCNRKDLSRIAHNMPGIHSKQYSMTARTDNVRRVPTHLFTVYAMVCLIASLKMVWHWTQASTCASMLGNYMSMELVYASVPPLGYQNYTSISQLRLLMSKIFQPRS